VSRQHCEIFEKDGYLVVRDLGSLNGTFIGEKRISEAVLRDGELLTVGTVTFRAVYSDDPDLSAPVRAGASGPAVTGRPVPRRTTGEEEGETERVQPSQPAAEEDDAEFVEFLQSIDVEAESADGESAEGLVEPALEASVPPAEPAWDEAEEIDEVDGEAEDAEPVDEADAVEEIEMAEPAVAAPAAEPATATAASGSPDSGDEKAEPGTNPDDGEDDELQSFLRQLDI
jgi:predicted component of type VI protein secretion system